MVTKQQQLEWLAIQCNKWPSGMEYLLMSDLTMGLIGGDVMVTRQEWQHERDRIAEMNAMTMQMCNIKPLEIGKMSGKPEPDNSWHERGELPPVGIPVELWFGGSLAYNCEFIVMRGNDCVVWNLDDDKPDCADRMNSQFLPLRTEREKAIEDMSRVMHEHDSVINDDTLGALYDAGYRRVAP